MDLLQTVRKEGSRGGRGDFKWSDVQASTHRENYLGHSVMAPVGRWQKNKDLSWYAKGKDGKEMSEAEIRKEEIKRIKQAEEDALAKALGYEPTQRPDTNANLTALGEGERVQKVVEETVKEDTQDEEGGKGLGFGEYDGTVGQKGNNEEVMAGSRNTLPGGLDRDHRTSRPNPSSEKRERRRRSRSRSRDRERHHRRKHEYRSRSRSQSRSRSVERRRSRSPERSRHQDEDREKKRARDDRHHRHRYQDERRHDDRSRTYDDRRDRRRRSRSPEDTKYHSDRRRRNHTDNY